MMVPNLPLALISSKMFGLCDNPVQLPLKRRVLSFCCYQGKLFYCRNSPPPPATFRRTFSRVSLCLLSDTLTPLVIMPVLKETLLNFSSFLLACSFFFLSVRTHAFSLHDALRIVPFLWLNTRVLNSQQIQSHTTVYSLWTPVFTWSWYLFWLWAIVRHVFAEIYKVM